MAKKATWKVKRLDLLTKILRIDLSHGAKMLWSELAFNWCWTEPDCCPHQTVLATALRVNVNTISRWAIELENGGLLTRTKLYRGRRFQLAEELPNRFTSEDKWRFNNYQLTRRVRGKTNQPMTQRVDTLEKRECDDTDLEPHSRKTERDTLEKRECHAETLSKIESERSRKTRVYRSGMNRKRDEKEKRDELKSERPGKPVAQSKGLGSSSGIEKNEGSHTEQQRTYAAKDVQPEDKAPVTAAVDPRENASEPPGEPETVQVDSPALNGPEDVLALLRSEVEEKYGFKGCGGLPNELSGKAKAQIRDVILRPFKAEVVISMVRVLVWDWEIVRTDCFPFRPQVSYPTVEALVQYQETLASSIETGLTYSGTRRGAWKTYALRFLKEYNPLED